MQQADCSTHPAHSRHAALGLGIAAGFSFLIGIYLGLGL
jgi:hypothetical protein